MYATLAFAKRRREKKIRPLRDSNPWTLRYRCSALQIKLTSQLGAGQWIGHFRVSPRLCFKTRLRAQPLIWKWFFILMQIKLIFTRKFVHLVSFWKWRFLEVGSGLLVRYYKWKDDDEVMNKWKSYMRTAEWRIIWRKITAVMYATFAVAKRKPEKKKIQACTGFEPLTSAMPVQRSAMIFLHIILYSAVHIYDFHMPCNKFWSFMFPRHINLISFSIKPDWLVHIIKGYFLFGGKWLLHLWCDPNSLKATKLFQ